ncbi:MAG: ribokinase [Chitinophagaceae bacterium]|nr:ribokinase [Anaerolineae bacterium]
MTVVVFGSINMDLVVRSPHLPVPGQTLTGQTFYTVAGGKGANQAVACARLAVPTRMVGRVGGDDFGTALKQGLHDYGVETTGIFIDSAQPSGVALITVDDRAENTIIVVPGANGAIDETDLPRLEAALDGAKVLLLQLEIPLTMALEGAQLAHSRGITVILDPAPAQPLPSAFYGLIDILTPNESEAEALVGFKIEDQASARRAAEVLMERGAKSAIIKMGSRGAYWRSATEEDFVPVFPVKAIDTVAAGDAFNGGLASALSEGLPMKEAILRGMATGALSTTKPGAQPSMPSRLEVEALLR